MKKPLRLAALITTPCLALGAVALAATPAQADALQSDTIAVAADTYANTAHADTAYGTTTDFRVGNAYGGVKIGYLHFDIPSAEVGRVVGAQLQITRTDHHLPATTITASATSSGWNEAAMTAQNAPAPGAVLDTESVNSATNTVTFTVTGAVSGSGVDIALSSPITTDTAIFDSREAGKGAPQLILTLSPPPPPPPACTVSPLLVSSCQVWLGDAPQSHYVTASTQTQRLAFDEGYTGRQFDILHQYYTNGQLFPTAETINLAVNGGRILSENWKPATDMTWAQVAAGKADSRIDAEANYLKSHFTQPFFLTIYHEPEDNVVASAGSGMTTADYVAMYRHVVLRLRADGATNAVTVMNYMGYYRWDPMRDALYPGDDVVDWIAWDPYMGAPSAAPGHDFSALVNTPHNGYQGFYDWATTKHPGKPLMLAEWGAFDNTMSTNPNGMADFFGTVAKELPQFPALKALDYFTMNPSDVGEGNATQPTENSATLASWQQMVQAPALEGPAISYANNAVVTK